LGERRKGAFINKIFPSNLYCTYDLSGRAAAKVGEEESVLNPSAKAGSYPQLPSLGIVPHCPHVSQLFFYGQFRQSGQRSCFGDSRQSDRVHLFFVRHGIVPVLPLILKGLASEQCWLGASRIYISHRATRILRIGFLVRRPYRESLFPKARCFAA
jgi:hypothetical protein